MKSQNSTILRVIIASVIQLSLCQLAQAQQPALFTQGGANGVASSSIVSRFDLTTLQGAPIATVGGFAGQGLTCGPDGKLYVALSGYGCCSPARQILRLNLDGTGQTTVLDFDTTPALATSGGPNGLAFGADGTLFFNTVLSHGSLPATGVWKLPPGSTVPTQVILPTGNYGLVLGFLTAPPFAGDLIASVTNPNIIRVAPPFGNPQTGTDFITTGLIEPGGLAVDNNGNLFISEGAGQTSPIYKYAPDGTSRSTYATISGNASGNGGIAFDGAGNLYVATSHTSGASAVRVGPDGTQTPFGDVAITPAGALTVCPALATVQTVSIEIKPPAIAPVPINQSSSGVIPVAILSSGTFDATQIDPSSVSLAGARVKMIGKSSKYSCSIQDVNGDGLNDLLCQVSTAQFMIEPGDSTAELEAQASGGQPIQGHEAITIVPQ